MRISMLLTAAHCFCAAAFKLRPCPALLLWAVAAGVRLCHAHGGACRFMYSVLHERQPNGLVNYRQCTAISVAQAIAILAVGSWAVNLTSSACLPQGCSQCAPGLCCRRRAVVRLGRRRSDELYAEFTNFPQGSTDKLTYANDTMSSLSLHGAPAAPLPALVCC